MPTAKWIQQAAEFERLTSAMVVMAASPAQEAAIWTAIERNMWHGMTQLQAAEDAYHAMAAGEF